MTSYLSDRFEEHYPAILETIEARLGYDEERVQNSLCWAWEYFRQNAGDSEENDADVALSGARWAIKKSRQCESSRQWIQTYGAESPRSVRPVPVTDLKSKRQDILAQIASRDDSAASRLDELIRLVGATVAMLDETLASVARLAAKGYSQAEIAERKGCSLRTVQNRYSALREYLARCDEKRKNTVEDVEKPRRSTPASTLYLALRDWIKEEQRASKTRLVPYGLQAPNPAMPAVANPPRWANVAKREWWLYV